MGAANNSISMNKKYYLYSGAIIIILLMLVLINENKGNYYKMSVEDAHALLETEDINISSDELKAAGTAVLQVNVVLEDGEGVELPETENYISIPVAKLLNQKFIKRLKKQKGPIAIVTEDVGLAVQSWLILTRLGVGNMKILDISKNEVLRYTFEPETKQPDTHSNL
jgi:hypothetical protein